MLILVLGGNVVISFENDYLEGAHEKVLKRLVDTNLVQASGYGFDQFTAQAIEKIKDTIDCPNATIRFLVGGTQTNQVVINSMLESYEGVISADTGHVAVHEGGAIEYSGHKVITIPSKEGKVSASDVETYMETFKSDFKKTIWYSQEWYIFLILLNMAHYTLNQNWKSYAKYVSNISFHYLWMVHD